MQVFEQPPIPPKRDKQVKFYVTDDERSKLQEAARLLEMGVPDLIRGAINEYVTKRLMRKKAR